MLRVISQNLDNKRYGIMEEYKDGMIFTPKYDIVRFSKKVNVLNSSFLLINIVILHLLRKKAHGKCKH